MSRSVVVLASLFVLATVPALACSCGPPNPKQTEARVEMLFEGSVVSQSVGVDLAGKPAAVIRVKVDRMVKGRKPASGFLTLHAPPHPAACGVDYTHGFTGRFGASMHTGGLYTSSCTQYNLNLDRYRR